MRKNVLIGLIAVFLLSVFAYAGTGVTKFNGGLNVEDSVTTPDLYVTDDVTITDDVAISGNVTLSGDLYAGAYSRLGNVIDSAAAILMYVRNKSGDSLRKGNAVIWDAAEWKIDSLAKDTNVTPTAATMSTEGSSFSAIIVLVGTAAAADTIWLYGTDYQGNAAKDTIKCGTNANDTLASAILWSDIDSLIGRDADNASLDSIILYGVSFCGVTVAGASADNFAGIVYDNVIADNAVGTIVIYGKAQARVEGDQILEVGQPLTTNARANLVHIANNTAGDTVNVTVGFMLQGGQSLITDTLDYKWMFVDPR